MSLLSSEEVWFSCWDAKGHVTSFCRCRPDSCCRIVLFQIVPVSCLIVVQQKEGNAKGQDTGSTCPQRMSSTKHSTHTQRPGPGSVLTLCSDSPALVNLHCMSKHYIDKNASCDLKTLNFIWCLVIIQDIDLNAHYLNHFSYGTLNLVTRKYFYYML